MKRHPNGITAGAIAALFLAMSVAGCAGNSLSGDTYTRGQTQQVMNVKQGTVVSTRPIAIQGTKSGGGTLAGGLLGGALGSGIGRGTGRLIGAVGGAIVGGLAGTATEEAATKQNGIEITVDLDGGGTIAVVQGVDLGTAFAAGDRVRVLTAPDGSARVSK